jgi:hypothetical protein
MPNVFSDGQVGGVAAGESTGNELMTDATHPFDPDFHDSVAAYHS